MAKPDKLKHCSCQNLASKSTSDKQFIQSRKALFYFTFPRTSLLQRYCAKSAFEQQQHNCTVGAKCWIEKKSPNFFNKQFCWQCRGHFESSDLRQTWQADRLRRWVKIRQKCCCCLKCINNLITNLFAWL